MTSITHSEKFYEKKADYILRDTKICIKCELEKDKSLFTNDSQHRDGKYPICNECKKLQHRKLYKNKPEVFKSSSKKWAEKNPEKRLAHIRLNRAVRSGKITKPNFCQMCEEEADRIEAHHWKGYESKHHLDVQWVCCPCHMKIHHTQIY